MRPGCLFLAGLLSCGFALGCTPQSATALERIRIHSRGGEPPARAFDLLPVLVSTFEGLFLVETPAVSVALTFEEGDPSYAYDGFDPTRGRIEMLWPRDDPEAGEWTLVHELAHAYQFALDPEAYEEEPSWIHEGWAEYALWSFLRARNIEEARRFLRTRAEGYLEAGIDFAAAFEDVYGYDWDRSYPACFLAVLCIAMGRGGERGIGEYFALHGQTPPEEALRRALGRSVAELGAEVEALALEILR